MLKFYPHRSSRILPAYTLGVIIISVFCFVPICKEILQEGDTTVTNFFVSLLVVAFAWIPFPLINEADKAGYYLAGENVIWRNLFLKKSILITDIQAVLILNNQSYVAGARSSTPAFETIKTEMGEKYVYAMILVKDLSKININYTSNVLFLRDHKNVAFGSAIYNEEFINTLLKINKNIQIIKGKLIECKRGRA